MLGLEFLIAGDIIRTVAAAPMFENAFVLALIVVIRTFLSMALQLELYGRWPWEAMSGSVMTTSSTDTTMSPTRRVPLACPEEGDPRKMREIIGGPGRTRTCDLTVMSGQL